MWWATALLAALLAFWSLLTPVDRAPDEMTHADLVFHLAETGDYPEHDERRVAQAAGSIRLRHLLLSGGQRLPLGAAEPRAERPTFDELGGDAPSATGISNQMPQHPPFYYWAAALVVRAERAITSESWAFEREWHLVRLFSAAFVVPLPVLAWLAARRLGAGEVVARTAALFPLAIPQLHHVGASITNEAPRVLFGGLLAVLLAGVLRGDASRRTAAVIGIVCGVGLLTKAFGAFLVVWVAIVYATAWLRSVDQRRGLLRAAPVAGAASLLVGGWWWVVNLLRHGTPTPSIEAEILPERAGFSPDVVWWAGRAAVWLPERFWGTFDWLVVPMNRALLAAATVLALAAVAAAFAPRDVAWLRRPDPPISRLRLAAFGSLGPVLLLFVLQHAWTVYARSGRAQFLQGRYFFSALAPLAVLVGIGAVRLLGRWAPVAIVGGAAAMVLDGWRVALHAWWGKPGSSPVGSLRAADAWNPIADQAIWSVLAIVVVVALALGASVARDLRRDRSSAPGTDVLPDAVASAMIVPSPERAVDESGET